MNCDSTGPVATIPGGFNPSPTVYWGLEEGKPGFKVRPCTNKDPITGKSRLFVTSRLWGLPGPGCDNYCRQMAANNATINGKEYKPIDCIDPVGNCTGGVWSGFVIDDDANKPLCASTTGQMWWQSPDNGSEDPEKKNMYKQEKCNGNGTATFSARLWNIAGNCPREYRTIAAVSLGQPHNEGDTNMEPARVPDELVFNDKNNSIVGIWHNVKSSSCAEEGYSWTRRNGNPGYDYVGCVLDPVTKKSLVIYEARLNGLDSIPPAKWCETVLKTKGNPNGVEAVYPAGCSDRLKDKIGVWGVWVLPKPDGFKCDEETQLYWNTELQPQNPITENFYPVIQTCKDSKTVFRARLWGIPNKVDVSVWKSIASAVLGQPPGFDIPVRANNIDFSESDGKIVGIWVLEKKCPIDKMVLIVIAIVVAILFLGLIFFFVSRRNKSKTNNSSGNDLTSLLTQVALLDRLKK